MKEITDGKILLRQFRPDDVDAVYDAVRESFHELSLWMPWAHANYNIDDTKAFVLSREEAWKGEGEYSFAVIDKSSGKFLGGVGLNQVNRIHLCCNLGYWVRSSEAGRGVASSAAKLAARFGLEELGLQRVEILAAAGNYASRRVGVKAGAKQEGVLRKRLFTRGYAEDAVVFSFVAGDLL